MRRTMMLALSVALLVPALADAQRQEGRRPRDGREMPMRPPAGGVSLMLENASELRLTEDQTTRLKAIQARYEEKTAPLRARADSLRPARDGQGAGADSTARHQRRQAAGEIMTLLREEGQSARTEAMALLSNDQKQKVEALEEARRKEMESRRGRRGPGGEGRRGGRGGPPAA